MSGTGTHVSASVHQSRDTESAEIQDLYRLFFLGAAPALIGPNQETISIPEPVFNVLRQVIGYMRQGKGVSVVPVMEELTTQRAANILGVSRPFLIQLLERGEIPHHKTGTHRRIYLKDVLGYQKKRDLERKKILDELARKAVEEEDYDRVYAPDNAE